MPLPAAPPALTPSAPPRADGRRWRIAAFAALFATYFFFVSWDTIKVTFALDEMMAIYWYWHPSPWRLLSSQIMLWRGYVRPMGAIFYLPPYLAFGLNPVPFHVILLLLLLLGAYLMYRLARTMGLGDLPCAIVVLIACYHGGLSNLYFNTVFIFDVLCGIFYFGALAYYVNIRKSGRLLSGRQTLAFLGLFLCATNSKEMAVTMPLILLAYEWIYYERPRWTVHDLIRWLRGPGQILCWMALINVVSIYGKAFGSYGLMKRAAYQPVSSWQRIITFQERYIGDLFYHLPSFGGAATIAIWLAVTWLAWRRPSPLLRFCWFYMVLTPLPLMVLEGRDQACLYVCLAGWSMFAGVVFTEWLDKASAEPLFRRLNRQHVRTVLAAAAMVTWAVIGWRYKQTEVAPTLSEISPRTAAVLAQFWAVKPQVPSGSTVVFLKDPFPEAFDMAFIAELWFRDRKTRVLLNQKTPLRDDELAKAADLFTWEDGKLIRVR